MTTVLYSIARDQHRAAHVRHAVAELRAAADTLIVVTEADRAEAVRAELSLSQPDRIVTAPVPVSSLRALQIGLTALHRDGFDAGAPLIATGAHVFAPLTDPRIHLERLAQSGAALYAPYWHASALDPRLARQGLPARIPYLDFAIFAPALLADDGFWTFWQGVRPTGDAWADFLSGPADLAAWLEARGLDTEYALAPDRLETADPRLCEVHKLVEDGAPCLPVSVLTLDPVLHDLEAVDLRAALDGLRDENPTLYAGVLDFAAREVPLRDFNSIADQYEVIAETAADPGKRAWSFGPVAVFIHAFYARMMPEFWAVVTRLPCEAHLFLTCATEADRAEIETFLDENDWPASAREVRVVEQNRGRDMSSLFITWRDVALAGRYEVALRLHSKRTPQVSRQVGEGFKAHLFENLAASPGHVANLLDRLEAEPDIGLVIPPAIHTGFGTLGHGWYNNKQAVFDLIREMGIEVQLDPHTPVAPYGTMFWFRPAALAKMFERDWRWEDYNPEPHHVDGGLAHVQERLIGYVVQGSGYRVWTVMTPRLAARYYARLEYKLQLLAGHLMSGHILLQLRQLEHGGTALRAGVFRRLARIYGRALIRWPALRGPLKPLKNFAVTVLSPSARR